MKKILLVDNSHFFVQSVIQCLSRPGIQLVTAESGEDALSMLKSLSPDLILLDYYLEDMSGDECCRKIRAKAEDKSLPIIVFTAAGHEEDIEKSIAAGGSSCIEKPVEGDVLLEKVKIHLDIPFRAYKRASISVPVSFYYETQRFEGTVLCIGEGGMFIKSSTIPPNGSLIQGNFTIPQVAADIEVKAEIVWNSNERQGLPSVAETGFGCRFLAIGGQDIEAIKTYVGLGDSLY